MAALKKKSKNVKANKDYSHLRDLAQQETAPKPLTSAEIKQLLVPGSFKQYEFTMQLWKDLLENVLYESTDEPLFKEAPSAYRVKIFIRWLAESRIGNLDESISDTTARNRLSDLKRAVKLHTKYTYSRDENEAFEVCIKQLIQDGVLSTAAYPKPVAPLLVAEDLVHFLWACDEYQMLHPRARLQLCFAIILISTLGCRPGEMIESEAWKGYNEGFLYKDIELYRQESTAYTGFLVKVTMRNRKGYRDLVKHAPEMMLCEEKSIRSMCPVTYFTAMALADGVFDGCESFSDLQAKKIPPGSQKCRFTYKADAKNRPILRSIESNGAVSNNRILSYGSLNNSLKGLGQRACYQDKLSSYCFRRAFARTIIKKVKPAEGRTVMSHKGDEPMGFYISGLVGIDSQSLIRDRPQNLDLLEEYTSMMGNRNLLAPQPPMSRLTSQTRTDPNDEEILKVATLTPSQQYDIRRRSRNVAYLKERARFFETGEEAAPRGAMSQDTLSEETNEDTSQTTTTRRLPTRYLQALLKFEPDRKLAVDLMFKDGHVDVGYEVPLEAILKPMIELANSRRQRYTYRSVDPSPDNKCSVCEKELDPKRPARMNTHLLQCARKRLVQEGRAHMQRQYSSLQRCKWHDCDYRFRGKSCGSYSNHVTEHLDRMESNWCLWDNCHQTFDRYECLASHLALVHHVPSDWTIYTKMHYCYEHDAWCGSDQRWYEHLRTHLTELNEFCGLIRKAGVVVVAAHCMFCLGSNLPIAKRFAQFHDVFLLHKHIRAHLLEVQFPLEKCPHPRCKDRIDSEQAFWRHANLVHGSPPFGPPRVLGKRKAPDEDGTEGTDDVNDCQTVEEPDS